MIRILVMVLATTIFTAASIYAQCTDELIEGVETGGACKIEDLKLKEREWRAKSNFLMGESIFKETDEEISRSIIKTDERSDIEGGMLTIDELLKKSDEFRIK